MKIQVINSFKGVNFKSQTEYKGNCYPDCPIHSSDYTPQELADTQTVEAVWHGHYRNERELEETLKVLLQKNRLKTNENSQRINQVDVEILNDLNLKNLQCVNVELQGYKGSSPYRGYGTYDQVEKLKEAGIKTIIDVSLGSQTLSEACKEHGITYYNAVQMDSGSSFLHNYGFEDLGNYLDH